MISVFGFVSDWSALNLFPAVQKLLKGLTDKDTYCVVVSGDDGVGWSRVLKLTELSQTSRRIQHIIFCIVRFKNIILHWDNWDNIVSRWIKPVPDAF